MKGAILPASPFSDAGFADSLLQITIKGASKDDLAKQRCGVCGTTNTPCWRKGPAGPKTLCNRCGVHWYQNKDRWEHIVEELKATRMDETLEQAAVPTRTVIKKKVDPQTGEANPVIPDSQRCVKSNGRGWRCAQRRVTNYSYCAHHQRSWDGNEKQWRKAFPNMVYPKKVKKQKAERKPKLTLPEKSWRRGKLSDDSSDLDFGTVPRSTYGSDPMQLVLPSETDTRPLEGYVSDDEGSQLYHGTQLSEERGESLESAKSPDCKDAQPKQEPSLRSEITTLSGPDKPPAADDQRCAKKGEAGRCPRPRQLGLRFCARHGETHARLTLTHGGARAHACTEDELDILLRLQLKRKRSDTGKGLGLSWKTKKRRPFSSKGGRVEDVKQGSDLSQDSPRPENPPAVEWDPPETKLEEDDLGVEELKKRLAESRGAIAALTENNAGANQELTRLREERRVVEQKLDTLKSEVVEVERLRKAIQTERANGVLLGPEALSLADQFKHRAVLLSKQDAHLRSLRASAEDLQTELDALKLEKSELQVQLSQLHKASVCTLCTSGALASAALVPCGHLYCSPCTAGLLPAVTMPAVMNGVAAQSASSSVGTCVQTSKCPCCLIEVKGRLEVRKPALEDDEMDGAVSLLGLLACESSW